MSDFPSLTGSQVVSALAKAGFAVIRVKGSHHVLRHQDGRQTIVPVHRGEAIGRGLMAKILRDAELTRQQFRALL